MNCEFEGRAIADGARGNCVSCGERFRSQSEQIQLDDRRFICETCYRGLMFPDVVVRCSELAE